MSSQSDVCHRLVNYLRSEGTHLKIEIISSANEKTKFMFRHHVLNLQMNRLKSVVRVSIPAHALCSKSMYVLYRTTTRILSFSHN